MRLSQYYPRRSDEQKYGGAGYCAEEIVNLSEKIRKCYCVSRLRLVSGREPPEAKNSLDKSPSSTRSYVITDQLISRYIRSV